MRLLHLHVSGISFDDFEHDVRVGDMREDDRDSEDDNLVDDEEEEDDEHVVVVDVDDGA